MRGFLVGRGTGSTAKDQRADWTSGAEFHAVSFAEQRESGDVNIAGAIDGHPIELIAISPAESWDHANRATFPAQISGVDQRRASRVQLEIRAGEPISGIFQMTLFRTCGRHCCLKGLALTFGSCFLPCCVY